MKTELVDISSLTSLITHMNLLHSTHSKAWLDPIANTYNLKTKQIRHVCSVVSDSSDEESLILDTKFLNYMDDYCEGLIPVLYDPAIDFFGLEFDMNMRIKAPDSRVAKLLHYMSDKNEKGRVNIKKCLNDLFGVRVWIENFDHSDDVIKDISETVGIESFRIYNASKNDYKATHAYFTNGNNQYFPWELQIWNPEDTESNICSHSIHKQGYTKWVENYHDLPRIEEVK